MVTTKVRVSLRSLTRRINRKLPAGQALKKPRGKQARADLGNFYLLDSRLNRVIQRHVDPLALGQSLGALEGWESVEGPQHHDE